MRCLYEFHLMPREYLALDPESKAFLVAAINTKDEIEKKELEKAERQAK